jgi:WD40 repeat protein
MPHGCNVSFLQATFSHDDSHIVSGSTDNHVYIWEVSPDTLDYPNEGLQ